MLICAEGIDGSGKSTGLKYVENKLKSVYRVHTTYEPGGHTEFAKDMRKFIFDHINDNLNPLTELLLFQAVRTELYSREVLPALLSDYIVLSDRCYISSLVYQGCCLWKDASIVRNLLQVTSVTIPNYVLYFKVDLDIALSRMSDDDPFKQKGREYWELAIKGYEDILETCGVDVYTIDANQSIAHVESQLDEFISALKQKIG